MYLTDLRCHGATRLRARGAAFILAAILAWPSTPVAAQDTLARQPIQRPPSDEVPVVLTVSGAISEGAYQGGVNWALLEFIRKAHDDPGLAGTLAAAVQGQSDAPTVPRFTLTAAAGASAGNINSILSAIEWCRPPADSVRPPEESLFWQIWVKTGWEQLFPVNDMGGRETNLGLFDRRYVHAVHNPAIDERMKVPAGRASCRVPVGITLTRLVPDVIPVDSAGTVTASTQRFASVVELYTDADGRSMFRQPGDTAIWRARELGRLIRLPGRAGTTDIPLLSVLQLAEASAAFPYAFAPVTLAYEDPVSCPVSAGRCPPRSDVFVDGGVFDNNPLDLAYGLLDHRVPQPPERTRVVYIDPDRLREPLASARGAATPSLGGRRGIGALLNLMLGAIPSAREYELQALARTFARDSERGNMRAGWIRTTDRSYPVVGEHLGAFAAFLGRPFREFDFYVGMYDGLRFVASDMVCRDAGDPRGCTARVLRVLLEGGDVHLGPIAPRVASALYLYEYADTLRGVAPPRDPVEADRAVFADALVKANRRLTAPFNAATCAGKPFDERLFCTGGFARMLDDFSTKRVQDIASRYAGRPECAAKNWDTAPDRCLADGSFSRLVNDRRDFAVELTELLLEQAWRVEDRIGWDRRSGQYSGRDYEGLAEALSLLSRSFAVRSPRRRGWEADPSTIPSVVVHKGERVAHVLPFFVGTNLDAGGLEVGYRPTYHLNRTFALTLPMVYNVRPRIRAASVDSASGSNPNGAQAYVGATAALMWKPNSALLSGVEAGPQLLFKPWAPFDRDHVGLATAAGVYLLGNKLRFDARYILDRSPELLRGTRWGFTLAIADFNGLVYWTGRSLSK